MNLHRHVWKILETIEYPTPVEDLAKRRQTFSEYLPWCFEREALVTSRCEKCGTEKVKRV